MVNIKKHCIAFKKQYAEQVSHFRELILSNLVLTAQIPAPAFEENARGRFILERFQQNDLLDCYMDEAGNTAGAIKGVQSSGKILIFAHMDTHFEKNVEHNIGMTKTRVTGPGLAYNSLGIAVLLSLPDIMRRLKWNPSVDIILLATTKSQGRGDMSGIRYFLKNTKEKFDYALNLIGIEIGRLDHFSLSRRRCDIACIFGEGSEKNRATMGQQNAIVVINDLINHLLTIPLPNRPRTLLNLGKIQGGESYHGPSRKAQLSLEIRSESDDMAEEVEKRIRQHAIFIGSKYGTQLELGFFGKQKATHLEFHHPLIQTTYTILNTLGYSVHVEPSNTEITVVLAENIPAVTLGITTGMYPLLEDGYIDIPPISHGLMQILMVIDVIEKGYCDETSERMA